MGYRVKGEGTGGDAHFNDTSGLASFAKSPSIKFHPYGSLPSPPSPFHPLFSSSLSLSLQQTSRRSLANQRVSIKSRQEISIRYECYERLCATSFVGCHRSDGKACGLFYEREHLENMTLRDTKRPRDPGGNESLIYAIIDRFGGFTGNESWKFREVRLVVSSSQGPRNSDDSGEWKFFLTVFLRVDEAKSWADSIVIRLRTQTENFLRFCRCENFLGERLKGIIVRPLRGL